MEWGIILNYVLFFLIIYWILSIFFFCFPMLLHKSHNSVSPLRNMKKGKKKQMRKILVAHRGGMIKEIKENISFVF
jgi:hypothetical protein